MSSRRTALLAPIASVLVCSLACNNEPPSPPTNADVFEDCGIEMLCAEALNQDAPDPTIATCIYEALRDRTPGRVRWEIVQPDIGLIARFDVFIGTDGRVLRWSHTADDGIVEEVSLRPAEFFATCITGVAANEPAECSDGQWFETGATEVDASCLTTGP